MKIATIILFLMAVLPLARAAEGDFSYDSSSSVGPTAWGGICQTGRRQTPININTTNVPLDSTLRIPLNTSYANRTATLLNSLGFGPELDVKTGNLTVEGGVFEASNVHFHYPSEHTIDNTRYLLEMHIVHKTHSGNIAVIGILYSLGQPSTFLDQFFDLLPRMVSRNSTPILVAGLQPPTTEMFGPYVRYSGSLTTPPCAEEVVWTVQLQPATLSQTQLVKYETYFPAFNATELIRKGLGEFRTPFNVCVDSGLKYSSMWSMKRADFAGGDNNEGRLLVQKTSARPIQNLNGRVIRMSQGGLSEKNQSESIMEASDCSSHDSA